MKLNKKGILTISLNKKAADCLIDIKVKATDKDQVASCNVLSTSLLPNSGVETQKMIHQTISYPKESIKTK